MLGGMVLRGAQGKLLVIDGSYPVNLALMQGVSRYCRSDSSWCQAKLWSRYCRLQLVVKRVTNRRE